MVHRGTSGGNPNVSIVNESGLYALIFGSKLPAARDFKRWVTSEVLPALRRTVTRAGEPWLDEEDRAETRRSEAIAFRDTFDARVNSVVVTNESGLYAAILHSEGCVSAPDGKWS